MPLHGWYSPGLVILSILVAGVASYAALELAARVAAARGGERLAWLAGGSLTMGLGIWSMHFVGMLAYHLPLRTTHSVRLVLLSLSVAIGADAIARFIACRPAAGGRGVVAGGRRGAARGGRRRAPAERGPVRARRRQKRPGDAALRSG